MGLVCFITSREFRFIEGIFQMELKKARVFSIMKIRWFCMMVNGRMINGMELGVGMIWMGV